MLIKKFLSFFVVLLPLVSCSNQTSSFSSDSQPSSKDNLLELPFVFDEIGNKDQYYILTNVKYNFDFSFSFSSNHLPMDSYSWEKGCLIAKKEFSNEEIIISLNGISKTIFLSAFDGPLFQKSIVLAFGYDDKNVPKYWPNYQDKIQNFGFLEEHKDELLYGDILSLTYSGEESWINSTETYYGSGSYCWISPRTTIIDIEIIESTIVSFAFDNLGRLLPIDQNIVIQSYDMKNCPNSINNGLVAFNADGSLIELNKIEGQIIYGSCSQYNIQDTKEYRVHAFYTYYPR
ncbi:MAG: hypothetical protein J6T25_04620 [Bacilli bacterium]|nr:hypothetical protein [Bacilli bacterium]